MAILIAFFCGVYTYRLGIKDGLLMKKDKPISEINPIKKVHETFREIKDETEADKLDREFSDNIEEILNYDGAPKG